MIAATINRTLKSFALAIVGAEYVLRWLPRGTHQWDRFVTPDELEIAMERAGLRSTDERGVIYNLLADRWELSTDTDVNYMVLAEKAMTVRDVQREAGPAMRLTHIDHASLPRQLAPHVRHLALGRLHRAGRRRPDRAQRDAARADREPRHGRRDACALPVRLSVRAALPRRRRDLLRLRAAAPFAQLHPVAARGRAVPDRRDRHDARRDGAALVRRRRCLHQDRTDPGGDIRRDLPRRGRQRPDDGGDRHRDGRRGGHVLQAGRHDRRHQADDHRARVRRHVRAVGHRLSRRDPRPRTIRTS